MIKKAQRGGVMEKMVKMVNEKRSSTQSRNVERVGGISKKAAG